MIKSLLVYIRKFPFLKQFIKFGIVGASAALINFIILYLFTQKIGIWYVYSSILGYIVSAIFNFSTNKLWTFRNKERGTAALSQAFKFSFVSGCGLFINTVIIYFFTDIYGLDYRFSWVIATAVVAVWNFSMSRLWTFKHKESGLSSEVI